MRRIGVRVGGVVLVGAVVVGACGGDAGERRTEAGGADETQAAAEPKAAAAEAAAGEYTAGEWTRLADPPLGPRHGAVAAWTGDEVVVVGGWDFLCPPAADCVAPDEPAFTDGAAFDPGAGTWRSIADAPQALVNVPATVVGGDLYVLAPCADLACDGGEEPPLLRWRPEADEWDTLPGIPGGPGPMTSWLLVAAGADLVAYATSDEGGEQPDWRFTPETDTWSELPDDPMAPSYDRQIVVDGDDLLLFAKPVDDPTAPSTDLPKMRAARLDTQNDQGAWTTLPDSPGSGFHAWAVDDVVVVNPHFGPDAGGGVFTPATEAWAPLPSPPTDSTWTGDMAGVIGRETAAYSGPAGWVLDVPTGKWLGIAPIDLRQNGAVTAAGRDLFVFGGERWGPDDPEGTVLDDAYIWRAP